MSDKPCPSCGACVAPDICACCGVCKNCGRHHGSFVVRPYNPNPQPWGPIGPVVPMPVMPDPIGPVDPWPWYGQITVTCGKTAEVVDGKIVATTVHPQCLPRELSGWRA